MAEHDTDHQLFEILWSIREGLASREELALMQAKGLAVKLGGVHSLTPRGILLLKRGEREEG